MCINYSFFLSFFAVHRLGELFRKLWNPRYFLFRAHVSPHEMLQAVSSVSKKRFKIVEQGKYYVYIIMAVCSNGMIIGKCCYNFQVPLQL